MTLNPHPNIVSDGLADTGKESSPWSDKIGVKTFFVDIILDFLSIDELFFVLAQKFKLFILELYSFHSSSKPSRALLVHFGARSHSIDGQVD